MRQHILVNKDITEIPEHMTVSLGVSQALLRTHRAAVKQSHSGSELHAQTLSFGTA
jgi:hypothetical protein